MCSAALLCDTSWAANQEIQGSPTLSLDLTEPDKNGIDEITDINESRPEAAIDFRNTSESTRMLLHGDSNDDENEPKSTTNLQQVARHDSGVPEDLSSPCPENSPVDGEEELDGTINSDCNVTVIHVTSEKQSEIMETSVYECTPPGQDSQDIEVSSGRDFTPDSKDSKDGSDSGVEGCVNELPRVEYASSCNGLDEASCDSSLVSCCSVYEDPCAIIIDDSRLRGINSNNGSGAGSVVGGGGGGGGEGTSEGGSESSSITGSVGGSRGGRTTSAKRSSFASSGCSSTVNALTGTSSKRKTDSTSSKSSSSARSNASAEDRSSRSSTSSRVKARTTTTPSRSSSSSRNNALNTPWRDRGRSRESSRSITRAENTNAASMVGSNSTRKLPNCPQNGGIPSNITNRTRTRPLPDSLPSSLTTEIDRDLAAQRGKNAASAISRSRGGATSSSTRGGRGSTPGSTPSEDSRKSLVSAHPKHLYNSKNDRTLSLDDKALETYATLPRARNRANFSLVKSIDRPDDINGTPKVETNKTTSSREASLNRLGATKKSRLASNSRDSNVSARKCLPPYPRSKPIGTEKTRIYHETSSQTGLTCSDIENALAGVAIRQPDPSKIESHDAETQTEDKWEDLRLVKNELETVTAEAARLRTENEILEAERIRLDGALTEERADHAFARQELDRNARRVVAMLGTPQSEHDESSDSFLELETHFQSSGQVVANQQIEIADLQSLCRMLNRDLEKSLAAQKALLQQQQELETESTEMQDFLQDEKATLVDALKDLEVEVADKNELLATREVELARLTEECKHLVRMSEQRRQENLSLGMKLNAVERRGRELLLGQGAAVSGASVALSGLGTRLEGLVDQLVRSYKISEKDLEDVVYHNEAYSRSNSSTESSPVSSKHSLKECTPSPKRGSFVSAVIGAIRNAATHPFATKSTADRRPSPVETTKHIFKDLGTESSSDLLDFETEPCLMMESVLEDVPLPDTYSHNMVSSSDSLRRALSVPEPIDEPHARISKLNDGSTTSLTNLTQAILNRRKAEDEEEVGDCDSQSGSDSGVTEKNSIAPITDYCPAVNLVDQVIDVDNLVTKLLKVLRIIQLDNDTYIRDLRDDKSELESKLEAHNNELEELRQVAANILDSDEIFADAVDDRRQTIVENRRESSLDSPAEEQNATSVAD